MNVKSLDIIGNMMATLVNSLPPVVVRPTPSLRSTLFWFAKSLFAITLISDSLVAQDADMTLADGQTIPVRIKTLSTDEWTVTSPIFEDGVRVARNAVRSLRFLGTDAKRQFDEEVFRFQLRSGEVLVGEIQSWDETTLVIRHVDLGPVSVQSSHVIDVVRLGKLYRAICAADLKQHSTAFASNLGTVRFKQGQELLAPFELTDDLLVKISFKLEEATAFRILLRKDERLVANVQLTVNGILSEAGDSIEFADCQLHPGIEQLSIHLSRGVLTLRDRFGRQVLSQELPSKSPLEVQVVNDGNSLEILQLDRNASCMATVSEDLSSADIMVVHGSGEVELGSAIRFADGEIQLQQQLGVKDIPLQNVIAIGFPQRTFSDLDPNESVVLWNDGTRINVGDIKIENSAILMESQSVSSGEALRALSPKAIYFVNARAAKTTSCHRMKLGQSNYDGKLVWRTSSLDLNWKFEGFRDAVRLNTNCKLSITELSTAGISTPPNLDRLLWENGTILPCKVLSISEKTVLFQSPYCDATEIPLEFIKGCVLNLQQEGLAKKITTESIERAMMIPRFARDLEPQHILVAKNGDLLRGTLVALDEKKVSFDSRAELLRINRERIHAIISLDARDDSKAESNPLLDNAVTFDCGEDFVIVGELLSTEQTLVLDVPGCCECRVPRDSVRAIRRNSSWADLSQFYNYTTWSHASAIEPRWKEPPAPTGNAQEMVGTIAPEIELETVSGEMFRLSDHRGKVVVLDFWATWCNPCIKGIPGYLEMMKDFSPAEVTFAAVNNGQPASVVEKHLKQTGWDVLIPLDMQGIAASKYNVSGIPHLAVIDQTGRIRRVKIGYSPTSANLVKSLIKELLRDD